MLAHRTHEPRVIWLPTQARLPRRHAPALARDRAAVARDRLPRHLPLDAGVGAAPSTRWRRSSRSSALDIIERHSINYLFTLPTILQALVDAPTYSPERLRSLESRLLGRRADRPSRSTSACAASGPRSWATSTAPPRPCARCATPSPATIPTCCEQAYGSRVRIGDLEDFERTAAPGAEGELLIDATTDSDLQRLPRPPRRHRREAARRLVP